MPVRDDTNLELVGRRIRGLLSKTIENGATEEEAILAAAKARELMDKYRVTLTDIQMREEEVEFSVIVDRPTTSETRKVPVDYCVQGIARYCGVRMWFDMRTGFRVISVLGLHGDVEMAKYLYSMLAAAIKSTSAKVRGRSEKTSFQVGMAIRLNERLVQMAIDLEPKAKTASGTALVVVKNAVVKEAFDKLGLHFARASSGPRASDSAAYEAGRAAGDRVNLNRPVAAREPNKMLR